MVMERAFPFARILRMRGQVRQIREAEAEQIATRREAYETGRRAAYDRREEVMAERARDILGLLARANAGGRGLLPELVRLGEAIYVDLLPEFLKEKLTGAEGGSQAASVVPRMPPSLRLQDVIGVLAGHLARVFAVPVDRQRKQDPGGEAGDAEGGAVVLALDEPAHRSGAHQVGAGEDRGRPDGDGVRR